MHDDRDAPLFDSPPAPRPPEWPERREPPGPGAATAVVVVLVALLAAAYWFWRERQPPAPTVGETAAAGAAAQAPPAAARAPRPSLDGSDAWVRELASALSSHPSLVRWLANDDLVRRLVAATIQIAEGTSPRQPLEFLGPSEGFRASRSADRWFVDPQSFRRYDLVVEVFTSIDAAVAARVYAELRPLLDQAYAEIGDPSSTYPATLERAVGNLLAVPVPMGEPELVQQGPLWAFADRQLEQLTTADKHLLRLGPENARRVQAKLRELGGAAGLALP